MHSELASLDPVATWASPERTIVAVLGLGYVGLPVATTFAEAGFRVVGVDVDPRRAADLRDGGKLGPSSFALVSALRTARMVITDDHAMLALADVVFVCVPTPLEDGEARHDAVRACAAAFAEHGRADALVVLESTVRPGFVDEFRALLGHGGQVALAYAPERIDPQRNQAGQRLRDIPRLVAGVDDDAQARAVAVLRAVGVAAHPVPLPVAEYAKLLENAYRLLNVAFIDEFATLCRVEGIDPRAVIEAAATKPFGFHAFWPGVGAGGHCVAVDPAFLVHRGRARDAPLSLLERAMDANVRRPRAVAASVAADTEPGDTVLVVGLTYKPGVPDTRESAALAAARALAGMNRRVLAFDAFVEAPDDLESVDLADGLARATAVVLLVSQPDAVLDVLATSGLTLFDATGTLPRAVGV
jgi:UDP-N-acetyl-D-glucosamine dehydrogenase